MLPTVTVIAFNIGWMLGGVVLVEQVFSYPDSAVWFYIPLNSATYRCCRQVFFVAAGYCFANLLADICYALLDPRIRYT